MFDQNPFSALSPSPMAIEPEPIEWDDLDWFDSEEPFVRSPFKIVACVNEGVPYRFAGLRSDKSTGERPIVVDVVRKPLYAMQRLQVNLDGENYLKGLADYSIDGIEDEIQIERKSLEDLFGTLGGRRKEFEAEILRLTYCKFAAVVIEAPWQSIFRDPPSHSKLEPKTVARTILSWSVRYPAVHWFTCESRDHAEALTYRLLDFYWRQRRHRLAAEQMARR